MPGPLHQLDRILRGDATQFGDLESGQIEYPSRSILILVVIFSMIYGGCVGAYSLTLGEQLDARQLIASAIKMPLLFLLTVVVTLPSLYVYNALVGSRLRFASVYRLILAALAVTVTVAASQGPIIVFFALSTTSYPFMLLLNVISLAVAGSLGLAFLNRTLTRLTHLEREAEIEAEARAEAQANAEETKDTTEEKHPLATRAAPPTQKFQSALDRGALPRVRQSELVFRIWIVVFGLVGAQMSWVLRPFVGAPSLEFSWFRERQSHFFEGVLQALLALFN